MAGAEIKHDYHLVHPSPWPIVGAVGAGLFAIGAVVWMRSGEGGVALGPLALAGPWVFAAGLAVIAVTMVGWWRDVVKESLTGENASAVTRIGLRYGMVLFIASEVMFFVAWFWAFFAAALFPHAGDPVILADGSQMLNAAGEPAFIGNDARQHFTGGVWPPAGEKPVEPLNPWEAPLLNTLILLLSGTTVTWAHYAIQHGDRRGLVNGLIFTVILGLSFTALQASEYAEALTTGMFGFSGGGIYGASFFMATGFHGLHVIIGTIFLSVCLLRALLGQFTPERHFGLEAAAWYWHFVDVVWLFLFANIYVLGNQGLLS
jgi:cytochrome c oxidase subunit 3